MAKWLRYSLLPVSICLTVADVAAQGRTTSSYRPPPPPPAPTRPAWNYQAPRQNTYYNPRADQYRAYSSQRAFERDVETRGHFADTYEYFVSSATKAYDVRTSGWTVNRFGDRMPPGYTITEGRNRNGKPIYTKSLYGVQRGTYTPGEFNRDIERAVRKSASEEFSRAQARSFTQPQYGTVYPQDYVAPSIFTSATHGQGAGAQPQGMRAMMKAVVKKP